MRSRSIGRTGGAPLAAPPRGGRAVLAAALVLAAGAACSTGTEDAASAARDGFDAAAPVVVDAPEPPAPDTSDLAEVPPAGTVTVTQGPFSDVLQWESLEFTDGTRPQVTGTLASTVDVAPLLQLDVRAAFYDSAGRYLGDATFSEQGQGDEEVHADEPGSPVTSSTVEMSPADPLPGDAASARLTVVQFVTE